MRPLNCDVNVIKFAKDVKEYEVIEFYVANWLTPMVVENDVNEDINDNGRGKRKTFEEEFFIDTDYDVEDVDESSFVDYVNVEDETDSEDEEYDANFVVYSDEDTKDYSDFEKSWDWANELPQEIVNKEIVNVIPTITANFEFENDDFDIRVTPIGSEDDETSRKELSDFKMPKGDEVIKFELGMEFSVKWVVKDVVKPYAMERKKHIHLKKNDKNRIIVRCMKSCLFYMRFSKRRASDYWKIVSFDDDHTCHRTLKNRQVKTKLLAKNFIPTLRSYEKQLRRSNVNSTIIIQRDATIIILCLRGFMCHWL